jgi:hypothetical protein
MAIMRELSVQIHLTPQEVEFALACRDFVMNHNPSLGELLIVEHGKFEIPKAAHVRKIFLEQGLARLLRVFQLAIGKEAISLEHVPHLISDLARFNEKIVEAFAGMPDHGQLH